MISIVLNLAQVSIALLLIFFNYSGISLSGQDIRGQAFLISAQIRIFLSRARGLAGLPSLVRLATTTTIIISSRGVGSLFNLKVFNILEILFYQSIAMKIISINFLYQERGLVIHLGLGIYTSLNDLLPINYVPIFFIQLNSDQGLYVIPEISNKEVIWENNINIKYLSRQPANAVGKLLNSQRLLVDTKWPYITYTRYVNKSSNLSQAFL